MNKRVATATVINKSGINTYRVQVLYIKKFPKYQIQQDRYLKILIHSTNDLKSGDSIKIQSCRPISKKKCYRQI